MAVISVQHNTLVADNAGGSVDRARIDTPCIEIGLGTSYKETATSMQRMEAGEVQVCPIHDIECSRFWNKEIEDIDVVPLAVGNMDKTGDGTSEIQQRMNLYYLHCHSAGNAQSSCASGWGTITGTGKSAKNNVVVAAITSLESMPVTAVLASSTMEE